MQVTPNYNVSQVPVSTGTKAATNGMTQSQAPSQFGGTERLNHALKTSPEVRAHKVKHARALISDSNYPPTGTIRQIANLLASKIGTEAE